MRIAMLTYSVKPRGGVVHALEVAEALAAPRPRRRAVRARPPGRAASSARPRCRRTSSSTCRPTPPFDERIQAHARGLPRRPARPLGDGGFDVVHAQDCLSANAALALRDEGVVDARAPHRAPRRRLHVAVADRVPGPLDRRARPRAVRVGARGCARLARRVRRARPARAQRRRHRRASGPPRDAARARARPRRRAASATASRCSPSAASSRARAR